MTETVRLAPRGATRAGIVVLARLSVAAAVYATVAALLTGAPTVSLTHLPLWGVLAGTVLVAWLLRALRAPIDALADRIVYGGRAPGYSEARALVARLTASLPLDEVLPQLAETIGQAVRSPRAEVRCWVSPSQRWQQVWPESERRHGDPLTVGVRHLGTQVGEIEVDQLDGPLDEVGRRRLDGIAVPVGEALATVRLTYALRARQAELERLTAEIDESTRRLLGARTAERQRFRDQLGARVMPLLDAALATTADSASADRAASGLEAALKEIRTISRGVFPPRLDEAGLAVCLREWADCMGGVVLGRVEDPGGPARGSSTDRPSGTDGSGDTDWTSGTGGSGGSGGSGHSDGPALRACLYFAVVTTGAALVRDGDRPVRITVRHRHRSIDVRVVAAGPSIGWPQPARDRLEAVGARLSVLARRGDPARVLLRARVPSPGAGSVRPGVPTTAPATPAGRPR